MYSTNIVDFVNLKSYEQESFAKTLANGIPNFVNGLDNFKIEKSSSGNYKLFSGAGNNNGIFFQLGEKGEFQELQINGTKYIYLKSEFKLDSQGSGFQSTNEIVINNDTSLENTNTIKYFLLYKLDASSILEDYRFRSNIKSINLNKESESEISISVNGEKSNTFELPANNTYTKAEINDLLNNLKLQFDLSVSEEMTLNTPRNYDPNFNFFYLVHNDDERVNYALEIPPFHFKTTQTTYWSGGTNFLNDLGTRFEIFIMLQIIPMTNTIKLVQLRVFEEGVEKPGIYSPKLLVGCNIKKDGLLLNL